MSLVITALAVGCGAAFLTGAASGYVFRSSKLTPSEKEILSMREQILNGENIKRNNYALQYALDSVRDERDDYKKIASTHEIKVASPNYHDFDEPVERTYEASINKNLSRMEDDLKKMCGNRYIKVSIQPWIQGAWKKHILSKGWTWKHKGYTKFSNNRVSFPYTIELSGDYTQIIDELTVILKDPSWSLWNRTLREWQFDSPFCFELKISAEGQKEPEIKIVEVLRIEKEIEIVEVIKEVLITDDDSDDNTKYQDLAALVASQVEVELALRENKRLESAAIRKQASRLKKEAQ